MSILFSCACGKALKVADEHAGKKTRCPTCGAVTVAPPSDAEEVEEIEVEGVEEQPQRDDERERTRRRKRRQPDRGGPMSRMYEGQALRQERRDRAMARAGDYDWGQDEDGGWTMFGIHITAGVISGAGMIFTGLIMTALILIFQDDEEITLGPNAFVGSIVFTSLGLVVLVKSLFFGEED